MKKIFVLFFVFIHFLYSVEIDEHKVDLYYANGIMMQESAEEAEITWTRRVSDLLRTTPELFDRIGKTDVAYNISKGMAEDLFESWIQKTNLEPGTASTWYAFKAVIGKVPYIGTASTILFDAAEYSTKIIHDGTLNTQKASYKESIKAGHGVVVVAHSQGNLFTQEAYRDLVIESKDGWMGNYFHVVSVATPGSEIPNGGHGIIFDNDFITVIPNGMKSNITTNPNRRDVYVYNALNELIGTDRDVKSIQYHGFEYYMGYAVWEKMLDTTRPGEYVRSTKVKTDKAKRLIMGWVVDEIFAHNSRPSQWEIKKELGCVCKEKYVKMTHKYDPALMDIRLADEKVKDFTSATGGESKIYTVPLDGKEQYVKASFGGASIEEISEDNSDLCYVLKNDVPTRLGEIRGLRESATTKDGVVEVFLEWDKPELDYDLIVEWDAGEVDVKDTGCAMEHFHILSEKKIYPGRYRVSVVPKNPDDEIWESNSTYPHLFTVAIKTPGASWEMEATVLSKQSIFDFGHAADIKVIGVEEDSNDENNNNDDDKNTTTDNVPNGTYPSALIIVPDVAPECPPVKITPSPVPPKPIYFPSYGSGGWGWSGYGNSSGGGSYSGGGSSAGGSSSPQVYPTQAAPECGGDVDCLPKPTDSNNGNNTPQSSTTPTLPYPTAVGGRPLPDEEDEEDNCTGNNSCGCIPCEYEIIPYLKQIYFGPLRDANFSIYSLDGYVAKASLFDGKTSNGDTLYDAGEIDVPQVFLDMLEDDKLYIIEAQGGEDIDRNDDFIVDSNATKNLGKVYAIASGKEIKYTGFKINILTTVTFELLKQSIENGDTQEEIEAKITQIASRLLRYKVYPNQAESNITNVDLLAWLPTVDKDLLLQSYAPLEEMVGDIYSGEDIYDKAYEYVFYRPVDVSNTEGELPFDEPVTDESKPPMIRSFIQTVSEDATGGTSLGKIEILRGSEDIYFGELVGKGSEIFEVDAQGEVRLKEDATLDYETKWLYALQVEAFNKNGGSGYVAVYISVKNVLDAPEYQGYEGLLVDENITAGTVVGKLDFNEGAAPIESMELIGESSDMFTIDKNGVIRLAEGKTLDYEQKYSYGFWAVANNSYGASMPVILYINVRDIADVPKITGYSGGYVHENAVAGTVVGEVQYDKGGADIDTVSLDGDGSEHFTIDINGMIRVAEGAVLDYETFIYYGPTVTVANAYGSATRRIPISVVNTDDVPVFNSFTGGNVKENASVGTVVGKISFDAGSMPIEHIRLSGEDSEKFRVLEDGTIVVAQDGLNYEEKRHYIVQATASNGLGDSLPVTVHIIIDDMSEIAAVLEDFVVNNVEENLSVGTVVGKIRVLKEGSSPIELFEISGDGADRFEVDKNGTVSIAKALDFEKQEDYNLKVKAKNSAGFGHEVNLIVRVSDVADVLPRLENLSFVIDENISRGTLIGEAKIISSGDRPIMAYRLSGDGSEKFDINNSGVISVKTDGAFDYERRTQYSLTLVAVNEAGESVPVSVSVSVLDVPDVKPILLNTLLSIEENAPEDTLVGVMGLLTRGDSAIVSYVLTGVNSNYFIIDKEGNVRVSSDANLDYEIKTSYSFQVIAQNLAGESSPVTLDVKINNIIDDEPVLNDMQFIIDENMSVGSIVGRVEINSAGTSAITNMTLSGTGANKFSIDTNGTVRLVEAVDYESGVIVYNLGVIATNKKADSSKVKVTIRVRNIPEYVPSLMPFRRSIPEDTTVGTIIGQIQVKNPGDSPIISYMLDDNSTFSIDAKGILRVAGTLDYETQTQYTLQVRASNSAGQSIPVNVTVNIINIIDDEPALNDANFTVIENTVAGTVIGTVKVNSTGASAITGMRLEGAGAENFSVDINGTVRLVYPVDYENKSVYNLQVRASNDVATSNPASVTIEIENVPENPPLLKPLTLSIEENASIGTIVGTVQEDIGGDSPIISYTLDDNSTFSIDANGTLRVAGTLDYETQTSHTLQVRASNTAGTSSPVSVTVNIINIIDDEPVLNDANFMVIENTVAGTVIGIVEVNSTGTSAITGMRLNGLGSYRFKIDANGTVRVARAIDYESKKVYHLRAIATNAKAESNEAQVTIEIENVPENPPLLKPLTLSIEENASIGTIVGTVQEDIGGDSPIISYTLDDNSTFSIDANGTLRVAGTLDYETQTSHTLQVRASNTAGTSSPVSVTVNIINIIDDEPILNDANLTVPENSPIGTIVGTVEVNSTGTSTITHMELDGLDSGRFKIDANGTVRVAGYLNYEKQNRYDLNIIAYNANSHSIPVRLMIVIEDLQEPEVETLRQVLEDKCGISSDELYLAFNVLTGRYEGSIDCSHKGLEDTDLFVFGLIKQIIGSLNLNSNSITSIDALSNLKYITGNLNLSHNALKNTDGLSSLESISSLYLNDNRLENIDGLSNVRYLRGTMYLENNPLLWNIRGLAQMQSSSYIYTDLIEQYTRLPKLTSRFCQDNYEHIYDTNQTQFYSNKVLCGTLFPEAKIIALRDTMIELCNIDSGEFEAYYDAFSGIYQTDIYCYDFKEGDFSNFDALNGVEGDLYLELSWNDSMDMITDFYGFNQVQFIRGNLEFGASFAMGISGFSSLEKIEGSLIARDLGLNGIGAFGKLEHVGSDLMLGGNQLENLGFLRTLRYVGGNIDISYNDYLTNIEGLSQVEGVEGKSLIIDNRIYEIKATSHSPFCQTLWTIKDGFDTLDLSYVCE